MVLFKAGKKKKLPKGEAAQRGQLGATTLGAKQCVWRRRPLEGRGEKDSAETWYDERESNSQSSVTVWSRKGKGKQGNRPRMQSQTSRKGEEGKPFSVTAEKRNEQNNYFHTESCSAS